MTHPSEPQFPEPTNDELAAHAGDLGQLTSAINTAQFELDQNRAFSYSTIQGWAVHGQAALTSLLAEGYLTIAEMPQQPDQRDPQGQRGMMSNSGDAMHTTLDATTRLVLQETRRDVRAFNIAARPGIPSKIRDAAALPRAYRQLNTYSDKFVGILTDANLDVRARGAAFGLGILSCRLYGTEVQTERQRTMRHVVELMKLNRSADGRLTNTLRTVRSREQFPTEDYFYRILDLTRLTLDAVQGRLPVANSEQ